LLQDIEIARRVHPLSGNDLPFARDQRSFYSRSPNIQAQNGRGGFVIGHF
jgi:hypothetical protein